MGVAVKRLSSNNGLMHFNGTSSYINCGNSSVFNSLCITVEFEYTPTNVTKRQHIFCKWTNDHDFLMDFSDNRAGCLEFQLNWFSQDNIYSGVLTAGRKYHVIACVDLTTMYLYIDGVLVSSKVMATQPRRINSVPFLIGCNMNTNNYWLEADMSMLAVYNVCWDADTVANRFANFDRAIIPANCKMYLNGKDKSNPIIDKSGNGNNGTMYNIDMDYKRVRSLRKVLGKDFKFSGKFDWNASSTTWVDTASAYRGHRISIAKKTDGGIYAVLSASYSVDIGSCESLDVLLSGTNKITNWTPIWLQNVQFATVSRAGDKLYLSTQDKGVQNVRDAANRLYVSDSGNGDDWRLLSTISSMAAASVRPPWGNNSVDRDATGHVTKLSNGRLIMPCGWYIIRYDYLVQNWGVYISDNDGVTWTKKINMYAYDFTGDYYEQDMPKNIAVNSLGQLSIGWGANQGGLDYKYIYSSTNGDSWGLTELGTYNWNGDIYTSGFDNIGVGTEGIYVISVDAGGWKGTKVYYKPNPVTNPNSWSYLKRYECPTRNHSPIVQLMDGKLLICKDTYILPVHEFISERARCTKGFRQITSPISRPYAMNNFGDAVRVDAPYQSWTSPIDIKTIPELGRGHSGGIMDSGFVEITGTLGDFTYRIYKNLNIYDNGGWPSIRITAPDGFVLRAYWYLYTSTAYTQEAVFMRPVIYNANTQNPILKLFAYNYGTGTATGEQYSNVNAEPYLLAGDYRLPGETDWVYCQEKDFFKLLSQHGNIRTNT